MHPKTDEIIQYTESLIFTALEVFQSQSYKFESFCLNMLDQNKEEVKHFLKPIYLYLTNLPGLEYEKQFMSNAKQVNDADIEEIVKEWKYNFRMVEDDHYAVDISIKAMYHMLKSDNLDSKVIQAIGKFIEAAKNLPKAPVDVNLCIELSNTSGNDDYSETAIYSFQLNEEVFHIDASGIERGPYGSDSYDKPSWYIERTGGRQCDLELAFFENEIFEFINMGAKITVEDY